MNKTALLLGISSFFAMQQVLADQVINDDLIVDGSTCVGFDCVNGEAFGFDTIKLKENNLRIKFDDTSNSASFPRNDWQLTANDSGNGGQEKFSIDDITNGRTPFTIEATAPSHSLYVEGSGEVGMGTMNPATELHIVDGDTPTVRLEQDGSSGFTPQTWDLAGNETNFFVRDVTNGSKLPFKIFPNAPTNSLILEGTTGDIGIGIQNPTSSIHVAKDDPTIQLNDTAGTTRSDWFMLSRDAAFEITKGGTGDTELELTNDGVNFTTLNVQNNTGNGFATLMLSNLVAGQNWAITNRNDEIQISKAGTGTQEMTIDASGNLEITGNFISNGTTLNVPDYVFEPQYKLRSLPELAAFIEKQGHLPNVPSAQEIKEKGINHSVMQMRLLEKVEELTLYTLEQQKVIDELKAKVASMEAR